MSFPPILQELFFSFTYPMNRSSRISDLSSLPKFAEPLNFEEGMNEIFEVLHPGEIDLPNSSSENNSFRQFSPIRSSKKRRHKERGGVITP